MLKLILISFLNSIFSALVIILILLLAAALIYAQFKPSGTKNIKLKKVKKIVLSVEDLNEDISNGFSSISFYDVKEGLKNLAKEKNIEELIIDIDNTSFSNTQLEELEPVFKEISKNMKIIAIGTNYGSNNDYLLALNANEIYMYNSYSSSFSLSYYSRKMPYYKTVLNKLGIKVNILHIGTHKSAGENFNKDKMSEAQRETLTRIYERLYLNLIEKIKEKRNVDLYDDIINGDLLIVNYKKAKEFGLIDGVSNFDKLNIDYSKDTMDFTTYLGEYKKEKNKSKNVIAVITAEGTITPQKSNKPYISYDNMLEKIEKVQEIDNLKGVILRVNSPGGSALEAEKIYKELKNIEVPIFVSMGDLCASGGYYISTVSRRLYANPSTLTGSIGVVSMYPTLNETLEKVGVNIETVGKSKNNDLFDFRLPLSESSKEKIISSMKDIYFEFKSHVMNARIMTDSQLEPLAGGRVWLGVEGKENNLVDKVGSFDDCVKGLVEYLRLEDYKLTYVNNSVNLKDKLQGLKPTLISAEMEEHLRFVMENKNKVMVYEEIEI